MWLLFLLRRKGGGPPKRTRRQQKKGASILTNIDRIATLEAETLKLRGAIQSGSIGPGFKDADTVLQDILDSMESEITCASDELIGIYKSSNDKESFEKLFAALTGTSFQQYLSVSIDAVRANFDR